MKQVIKILQFMYLYSVPQILNLVSIAKILFGEALFEKIFPDIKNRLQTLQTLVRRLSLFKLNVQLENDLVILLWGVKELVSIFF